MSVYTTDHSSDQLKVFHPNTVAGPTPSSTPKIIDMRKFTRVYLLYIGCVLIEVEVRFNEFVTVGFCN